MTSFRLKGAITAKDFIQDAIAKEYQLEITGLAGERLLVVFYKGTWVIQDPVSSRYVQMYDAPDVSYSQHTIGICDDYLYENPDKLWVDSLREAMAKASDEENGTVVTKETWENDVTRAFPARVLTELIMEILTAVSEVNVVKAGRNGVIQNGKIEIS